jgi:hypothetical protein
MRKLAGPASIAAAQLKITAHAHLRSSSSGPRGAPFSVRAPPREHAHNPQKHAPACAHLHAAELREAAAAPAAAPAPVSTSERAHTSVIALVREEAL